MQLAVSRICHDLVSPLGAISNGIELLLLTGKSVSPELQLVDESSAAALARLRFFRIAYGLADAEKMISTKELRGILTTLSQSGRIKFDWQVAQQVPAREVQAVFLAIQCLESALPYGGAVTVAQTGDQWRVAARDSRVKPDPALWQSLARGSAPAEVNAAALQFALLPEAVQALGRRIQVSQSDQGIEIAF